MVVPLSYSHRTPLQSVSKGLRAQGKVDLHARLYDAQGKAASGRVVSVNQLPAVQRILGMLLDCSSYPAIGYRDAATCDETAAFNLDFATQLSWQKTQPFVSGNDAQKLAINPRNIIGLTFNGNPFRSYGYSQNNEGQAEQCYKAFKYISGQMNNMPATAGLPNTGVNKAGQTYLLQTLKNGFVSFDGLNAVSFNGHGPDWTPHDATLFAVTALGVNGLNGSRAPYMYCGGTVSYPTSVYVDLSKGYFGNTGGTQSYGAISVSLVKYQMGDEVEWATVTIPPATATASVVALFNNDNAITQEDDYAVRIDYSDPRDARGDQSDIGLYGGQNVDPLPNGVQIGAQPVVMGFWGNCAMTMTWHAIPEIGWMLTEGVGFRGLAMHLRLYYNGPEGSNGAPNGNLAAAKLQESGAWRQIRDKCHAYAGSSTVYTALQDLQTYGPNRDEMMHISHENTHGLRYSEKITDLPQFQKLQQPWQSNVAFLTAYGQQPWCDGIVESAEYLYGDYTMWIIDTSNSQSIQGQNNTDGFGAFFGLEISWACERRVVRQSIATEKTPCRAKDWSNALEWRSSLPWAAPDTGYSVMDWMYHRNVRDLLDEETLGVVVGSGLPDYKEHSRYYVARGMVPR